MEALPTMRVPHPGALLLCCLAVLCIVPAVHAQAPPDSLKPLSTHAGVFTAAQAARGQELFFTVCGECHQPDDFGRAFLDGWSGQTVDALFREIRNTMPENSPGSLKSSEYVAVIAYLFQLAGVQPGETELPSSLRRLKEIRIDPPEPVPGGCP